ncbi:MAG: twin transmembrane helix small protein [Alphaproteobacteria bacterium]|nr:twin transmembrane helix small protein [Alphaproteobacteria bacterium SS10]
MKTVFFVLMLIAMMGALVSLAIGLFGMAQGGDFARKHGNNLMRLRILFQGAALLFFALAVMFP